MKKVFVCSPYAGDIEKNTENAKMFCKIEIMQGNVPFAPHLIYPQMLCENKPEERELGIRLGLEILKVCDELHVYVDIISSGMAREISVWREMGRTPIKCTSAILIRKCEF